jgi:hypothetical protein
MFSFWRSFFLFSFSLWPLIGVIGKVIWMVGSPPLLAGGASKHWIQLCKSHAFLPCDALAAAAAAAAAYFSFPIDCVCRCAVDRIEPAKGKVESIQTQQWLCWQATRFSQIHNYTTIELEKTSKANQIRVAAASYSFGVFSFIFGFSRSSLFTWFHLPSPSCIDSYRAHARRHISNYNRYAYVFHFLSLACCFSVLWLALIRPSASLFSRRLFNLLYIIIHLCAYIQFVSAICCRYITDWRSVSIPWKAPEGRYIQKDLFF